VDWGAPPGDWTSGDTPFISFPLCVGEAGGQDPVNENGVLLMRTVNENCVFRGIVALRKGKQKICPDAETSNGRSQDCAAQSFPQCQDSDRFLRRLVLAYASARSSTNSNNTQPLDDWRN
jgi:hypothetical protein